MRNLPRRIRVLALSTGLVLLAAGCGADDPPDAANATTTTVAGDTTTTVVESTTTAATSTTTEADNDTGDVADPGTDDTALGDSGCGSRLEPGQSTVTFDFEERSRTYELYVPRSYSELTPTPVVLNWHGLGSNGPEQMLFSEYGPTAERGGFLVVAPTGVPAPGDDNNSWELTADADPTRDDVAFANAVLDRVIATTCADESRIYTTGMSNGGYFSSVLICEMAERIAAAASVGALTHEDGCSPSRPVPYIGFHGVQDDIVPYDGGGISTLAPGIVIELFERVIPDEFGEFAVGYGCNAEPDVEEVAETVTAFTYSGCPEGVEAIFYRLDPAGHTWPGSTASALISQAGGLGVTNLEINATETSWEFFSRHSLP